MPLYAAEERVVVRSSSVKNNVVSLDAELAGKGTSFQCSVDRPPCSAVQPGEYVMLRAEAGEGIYNDCTNVVLYRPSPSSDAKEKIGIYCWLNDDCYIASCSSEEVQTIAATVPNGNHAAAVKHEWVLVGWQPIQWKSPPPGVNLQIKTSPAEILIFNPNGEFTDVRCLLIKRQDEKVVISNDDGQTIAQGHWTRQGEKITVESRVVYQTAHYLGQTSAERPKRQVFISMTLGGKWEVQIEGKTYKPMPEFADMDNLSTWAATKEMPSASK